MTEMTCPTCGSRQAAGAAWCAVCGKAFPRTGAPASAGPGAPAGGAVPSVSSVPFGATTEPERIAATVRGFAAPPPASPAPVYAGTGRRFAAYLLDTVAAAILPVTVVLVAIIGAGIPLTGAVEVSVAEAQDILRRVAIAYGLAALLATGGWLALVIVEGKTGRTVGGALLGVRTVDAQTLEPLGFGRALLRWLLVWVSSIVPFLMVLSPAFDSGGQRQGWHDKAARGVVLRRPSQDAPTGVAPAGAVPKGAAAPVSVGSRPPAPASPGPSTGPAPHAPVQAQVSSRVDELWGFPPGGPAAPAPSGLITGVPGAPQAAPPAPAPQAAPQAPALAPQAAPPAPVQAYTPSPAPNPGAVSAGAPVAAAGDDLDGETRMTPARPRILVLELASGEHHPVTARTLVGRNPQAPAGEPWDVLAVPDPTRSVSKTHAELHPDQGGLWLVDRGSTNGTVVSVPGRTPQVASPGLRVRVVAGATLHLGDTRIVVGAEGM